MPFTHVKAFLNKLTESVANSHSNDFITSTDISATKRGLDIVPQSSVLDDEADTTTSGPIKIGSRVVDATLTSIAVGDRADLISDTFRRILINQTFNIGAQISIPFVGSPAARIDSTPLAGRKKIILVNIGSRSMFLGFTSGLTVNNGLEIEKDSIFDEFFGEGIPLFLISAGNGTNAVFMEMG